MYSRSAFRVKPQRVKFWDTTERIEVIHNRIRTLVMCLLKLLFVMLLLSLLVELLLLLLLGLAMLLRLVMSLSVMLSLSRGDVVLAVSDAVAHVDILVRERQKLRILVHFAHYVEKGKSYVYSYTLCTMWKMS